MYSMTSRFLSFGSAPALCSLCFALLISACAQSPGPSTPKDLLEESAQGDEGGVHDIEADVGKSDTAVDTELPYGEFGQSDGDNPDSNDGWPADKYLSPEQVFAKLSSGAPFRPLNVSDAIFYELGHIEGSTAIPWDSLPSRLTELSKTEKLVIYCRRGVRSESAYETLKANGFEQLWVMSDGLERWIALGYPVVY
ncbi:MAG: rhodanese-like domain-containing protein [Myxococcota bacterium]|nr:rhodanese-like domain-containing protein [Myxococcota bacterium]